MSADDTTIRFATAEDAAFLISEAYVGEDVVRRKIGLGEFVIAVDGGEHVGFLQLEFLWSKVPYVALIRVLAGHRRHGIGSRMLGFLESHLRNLGHRELYSSSQADEPEPQEWHQHVGFEECGAIRGINDGIDEIFFRRSLSEE